MFASFCNGVNVYLCISVLPHRDVLIIHCLRVCMYVHACVCMYVCMYVYLYVYGVYVCVCMCIYVCVYVFKCGWIYGVGVGQLKTSYLTWRLQYLLQLVVKEAFRC